MNDYEILYISINVFCAINLLIMLFASKKSIKINGVLISYRVAISTLFALLFSDSMIFLFQHLIIPYNRFFVILFEDIDYFSYAFLSVCWFILFVISNDKKIIQAKKRMYICAIVIPASIELLVLFINKFIPVYYEITYKMIDGDYVYTYSRGKLFFIQYVIIFIYVLATSIQSYTRALKVENYVERKKYYLYALLGILPLVYGTLNIYIKKVPIANLGLTFSALFVFILCLNEQITTDFLTGLYNVREIMKYADKNIKSSSSDLKAYIFMIDLDDFKSINDTYGHLEGDNALRYAAEAFWNTAKKTNYNSYTGRYGGDEFLIASIMRCDDDAKSFIRIIEEEINAVNEKHNLKYKISASIGYARYENKMSLRDMIEKADEMLYDMKKEKPISHRTKNRRKKSA